MSNFPTNNGLNNADCMKGNNISNSYIDVNNQPYYVSGTPIANNDPVSVVNLNTDTPYDGKQYVGRRSTVMPNTYCIGSLYRYAYTPNARFCRGTCLAESECKSWAYDKNSNQCYLKNNSWKCVPDTNFTSGQIISNGPDKGTGRLSTVLHNVVNPSIVSKPDMTLNISNANACKDVCVQNTMCNQWSYIPEKCYLGYGNSTYVVPSNNAISGSIYTTKNQTTPVTPLTPSDTTNGTYDCHNQKLLSSDGDYCTVNSSSMGNSCYNVGTNAINPDGWYNYIGPICNSDYCKNANQKCMGKPSCRLIGEKCNLTNLKNLY